MLFDQRSADTSVCTQRVPRTAGHFTVCLEGFYSHGAGCLLALYLPDIYLFIASQLRAAPCPILSSHLLLKSALDTPHFIDDINAAEITLRFLLQMSTYLIWTADCVDNPSTENNILFFYSSMVHVQK